MRDIFLRHALILRVDPTRGSSTCRENMSRAGRAPTGRPGRLPRWIGAGRLRRAAPRRRGPGIDSPATCLDETPRPRHIPRRSARRALRVLHRQRLQCRVAHVVVRRGRKVITFRGRDGRDIEPDRADALQSGRIACRALPRGGVRIDGPARLIASFLAVFRWMHGSRACRRRHRPLQGVSRDVDGRRSRRVCHAPA